MTADAGAGRDAAAGVDVQDLRPIARPESVTLARTENERMVALLRSLTPDDWARPTDCPAWDVRAMAGHVLGMTETFTGVARFVATMVAGQRAAGDGPAIDGITAVQVKANARPVHRRAGRPDGGGRATAGPLARPAPADAGHPETEELPEGGTERWRLGFVLDTILTRDTWMHRVDIARATGRPLELTAEHDGRIVADVVREWADRHGRAVPPAAHRLGRGRLRRRRARGLGRAAGCWTRSSSAASCPAGPRARGCCASGCRSRSASDGQPARTRGHPWPSADISRWIPRGRWRRTRMSRPRPRRVPLPVGGPR